MEGMVLALGPTDSGIGRGDARAEVDEEMVLKRAVNAATRRARRMTLAAEGIVTAVQEGKRISKVSATSA
jgi:hypothetical protein